MSQTNRILWIDLLRAFGLLLVVMGHTHDCPSEVKRFIYSFHMPLFFFLSGYLWSDNNVSKASFKAFLKRKFQSLIIPYFKVAAVCWLTYVIITPLLTNISIQEWGLRNIKCLIGVFWSIGTVEWLPNCSPIWYLTSLFWANVFFYLVRRFQLHPLFIVAVLGLGWLLTIPERVIWNIGSATTGCAFMWIGYWLKSGFIVIDKKIGAVMLAALLAIVCAFGLPFVNMDGHNYSNYILFLVVATLICLLLMFIARDCFSMPGGVLRTVVSFIAANSIAIFGYNYAANSVVGMVNHFVQPHWIVNYGIVLVSLYIFIILINRLRIKRWFV